MSGRLKKLYRGGSTDPQGTYLTGGWQAYTGPGVLRYAVMDGTSLSSNLLTLYDSARSSTADPSISAWSQDTDFGTTVPVTVFRDGNIVATMGTASANTHLGVPFADGLFVNKTGDTTHDAKLTLAIMPLIKKHVRVGGKGTAADTVNVFDGIGVLHGVRITVDPAEVALGTLDITFKDSNVSGTGNTIWTGTNYVTAGPAVIPATNTTGIDDIGAAVTTAATGAYTNQGIPFFTGLHIAVAQGNTTAGIRSLSIDCLIEA